MEKYTVLIGGISIADTDDDSHRPSKRARADFRASLPSDDDLQSSPGRSRGHSRDDVPMTDQTEDDRDDVLSTLINILEFHTIGSISINMGTWIVG